MPVILSLKGTLNEAINRARGVCKLAFIDMEVGGYMTKISFLRLEVENPNTVWIEIKGVITMMEILATIAKKQIPIHDD